MRQIGLTKEALTSASKILSQLYDLFASYDARMVEINPLVITNEGKMIAADSRCEIDDNSLFKHPEFKDLHIQRIENLTRYRLRLVCAKTLAHSGIIKVLERSSCVGY